MRYDPQLHRRHSIRLNGYDYSNEGAYFVTLCTYGRECLLGNIDKEEMCLNEFGQVVRDCWEWLGQQYRHARLDEFVIMSNHLHGIIVITDFVEDRSSGLQTVPTKVRKRKPLVRLNGAFKTISTKSINAKRNTPGLPL